MDLKKITLTTPEYVSLDFNLAGLGSRAAASLLDSLVLGLIYAVLVFILVFVLNNSSLYFIRFTGYFTALIIILLFLLGWGYFALFEFFSSGSTPGKRMLGIRVIQDNGRSLTFLSSMVRNLFRIIDFLPSFYLLGIILIFFHPRYQRIGDIAGGTVVIYQQSGRKKKTRPLTLEMNREMSQGINQIDDWDLKKFGPREWELLHTYILRQTSLPAKEKALMTRKVAAILLPRLGIEPSGREIAELEMELSGLYLQLQKEWEYK